MIGRFQRRIEGDAHALVTTRLELFRRWLGYENSVTYPQSRIFSVATDVKGQRRRLRPDRRAVSRRQSKACRQRIDPRFQSEIAAHPAFSGGAQRSTPRGIAN